MGFALGIGRGLQFRRRVVPLRTPVLSVINENITIERAAPAPAPILSLTPPITIVIN